MSTITAIQNAISPPIPRPNYAPYLVDYGAFAADPAQVTGALTRAQWADYKNRFMPYENALMGLTSYNNPGIVGMEVDQAIGDHGYVRKATDGAADQFQRNVSRMGLSMTDEQRLAVQRQQQLGTSKSAVDAANMIRRRIAERDQQIAIGAVPNAGRAYGLRDMGTTQQAG